MDSTFTLWLTVLLAGLVTFLTRLSFIAVHGRVTLPEWFRRGLTFVPVAVLSAIILPELAVRDDALQLTLTNPRLLAGIVAIVIAWRTRNVWLTIAVGMIALWGINLGVQR